MGILKMLDRTVQALLRFACILFFTALGVILLTNVYLRVLNDIASKFEGWGMAGGAAVARAMAPVTSMHWFDEIVELLFAYLVFYGAAALWGTKGHFSVGDWISKRLPDVRLAALYKLCVTAISVLFIGVFCYYSYLLTKKSTELSTVFQIPKAVMYSCMPISSFIMLCYSLAELFRDVCRVFHPGHEVVAGQDATSM